MTEDGRTDGDNRSIVPFLLALGVIALIGIAIVVGGLLSPADKNVTESDRIKSAATNFVAAHNNNDAKALKLATCPTFDDKRSPLAGRDGKVVISKVDEAVVDGDRAKAKVTTGIDGKSDDKTTTWDFHREDSNWRVCD